MRVADFFCGAGGFSEGFRTTPGFEVAVGFDNCPHACATYTANQGCPAHELDLFTDKGAAEAVATCRRLGVDVVIGGPPCQGFSSNNQELWREGSTHKRECDEGKNLLPIKYARMLLQIRPKYLVMEEVALFLRGRQYKQVERILTREYLIEARVLNAAQHGTPQYRKRAIVVGVRRDLLPASTAVPFHPTPSPREVTVREAVRGAPLGPIIAERQLVDRIKAAAAGSSASIRYTCIDMDKPALTITTRTDGPGNGRFTFVDRRKNYRRMTVLQAALLQGFPARYSFMGGATAQRLQIGNAVPPPLARAIATQINVLAAAAGAPPPKKNRKHPPHHHSEQQHGVHEQRRTQKRSRVLPLREGCRAPPKKRTRRRRPP